MSDWCLTCHFEDYDGSEEPCINCVSDTEVEGNAKPTEYFPKKPPKPITNADRIRAKSVEEMAEWIMSIEPAACPFRDDHGDDCRFSHCKDCWIDWLKQEAGE